MRISCFMAVFGFFCATGCATTPLYPSQGIARFVVENLDVTSFPSSIGPRREKGKIYFKDYGLVEKTVTESAAELAEKGGGWRFSIKVLEHSKSGILICLEDQATNGGTYHTQTVLSLRRETDKGPLRAEKRDVTHKDCPVFGK
jgi:hypothetical protein